MKRSQQSYINVLEELKELHEENKSLTRILSLFLAKPKTKESKVAKKIKNLLLLIEEEYKKERESHNAKNKHQHKPRKDKKLSRNP